MKNEVLRLSTAQFAKEIGVSVQSVCNFVEQGRLIPYEQTVIGAKLSSSGQEVNKMRYTFTKDQVEDARFISRKGKGNNHVLALCIADSDEELVKVQDEAKELLAGKNSLTEVSSIGEFYQNSLVEHVDNWLNSKEYLKGLEKYIEGVRVKAENALSISLESEYLREKSIYDIIKRICFNSLTASMILSSRVDGKNADLTDEEISLNYKISDFLEWYENSLLPIYMKKNIVKNSDIIGLPNNKVYEDQIGLLKLAINKLDIQYNITKKKTAREMRKFYEDYAYPEKLGEYKVEIGQLVVDTDGGRSIKRVIGKEYLKLKASYERNYINRKQKSVISAKTDDNKKIAKIFTIESILTDDLEGFKKVMIRVACQEFGQTYIFGADKLNAQAKVVLDAVSTAGFLKVEYQ
ncbi:helix-turn-helix domain-containing protein [[Clostridium] fimetarium]|uniref:Uncharacterized protein n=1 Tax=[Clostridium] fimetarium TaxID=99656 RepID=A0A1I0RD64_9FIRM|nr:hypothetical protein [[Clostridium] fimetarium]SEW38783.1 hypothetical protein SAMN05421659_11439 [[Clostridium] fimetarium]